MLFLFYEKSGAVSLRFFLQIFKLFQIVRFGNLP